MKLPLIAFFAVSSAMAGMVTLEMDEVPNQIIDGLTVTKGGESFTFSDPGQKYQYNFTVQGTQKYLTNPGIAGFTTEAFGVSFSTPVDSVEFGMAELSTTEIDGVGVTLYDGNAVVSSSSFDLLNTGNPAVEALFSWQATDGQQVTSIEITPVPGYPITGIDNLSVDPVPEPASAALVFTAGMVAVLRRRCHRAN